ncbi:MAG: TonB-dependent receptor, partial [Bacteroidota bacterium]|nr:TonB-dependent receptor [Bacteroidota bacterium]
MKKKLFTILLIIFSFSTFAQKYEITAQIKDETSNNPIEFCNVFVFNDKDSIITKAYTNEKGFFNIPLARGKYKFILNMFGFNSDTIKDIYISGNKFLDVYKLSPADYELDDVVIKGNSRIIELDKDVQIVTTDLKKGAANSYDILDKVNGLHYDRYNQKISVDNDDNVIILVNGIEKNSDYIKNMNPDRLQKIEVIRDPSGRYGLKGYTAVINIVLKSNYKGTDINLSNFLIANVVHKEIPFAAFDYGNIDINVTRRKVNFYLGYAPFVSNFVVHNDKTQIYSDSSVLEYNSLADDYFNAVFKSFNHKYNAGIDLYLSPKHTLSFESSFNYSPLDFSEQSSEQIVSTIIDNNVTNTFNMNSISKTGSESFNNSLFYIAKFNDKNEMSVTYTYSIFSSESNTNLIQDITEINQITNNSSDFSELSAEYNHTFNNKVGISFGYGNVWKKTSNIFYPDKNDMNTKSDFSYQDVRNQAYAYLSYKPFTKLGIKFGLAVENSIFSNDDLKTPFTIYEPYLDIKYTPIQMIDIKLKYRSDANYPSINQLNPFTTVVDWQTVSTGNPNLTPEKSHKISLKLNIMNGLISLEPYYNFSENSIIRTLNKQDDNTWLYTYENAAKRNEKGLKINFTAPLGKTIFLQNG